jgi:hypothetical protein
VLPLHQIKSYPYLTEDRATLVPINGHVQKDCPKAKVLDYMRRETSYPSPNFHYMQGRPRFNASSSIRNAVPLCIHLKEFIDEQGRINKDTITKFKAMNKVL